MAMLGALLRGRANTERRSFMVTPQDLSDMLSDRSAAGRVVTEERALAQATVLACVRLISESVGMLPLHLYRRLERGKERADDHAVYGIVHHSPNPEMTAAELAENMAGHLALWGNAYCEIEYDGAGHRRAVWPLRPDRMQVDVNDQNQRVYTYTLPNGQQVALSRWRVWHVRGWGTDAWVGKSTIALAREAIGLALATEEFGSRFFGNGSRPGGVLTHPGKLLPESSKRLKDSWEEMHKGLSNSHRVAVLEEGVTWTAIGIPPDDAQFLETRAYQDVQICGLFRVPPHMISIVDKSTSWGTGIGQQTQAFVTFCLGPYLRRISQSGGRDLLTDTERKTLFLEHLSSALVQNDLEARYRAYKIGREGGWLSVNDILEKENENPVEGGDTRLQPMNMAPLGSEPEPEPEPAPDDSEEDDNET